MCEYAEYDENDALICKPKKSRCVHCIYDDAKQYNEILEQEEIKGKRMSKGFILATLVSLSIVAIWYALEYMQFGTLQWNIKCDEVVIILYFIALWIAFSRWK